MTPALEIGAHGGREGVAECRSGGSLDHHHEDLDVSQWCRDTLIAMGEVHDGLVPSDFTVTNIFDRLSEVGDLRSALRRGPTADVRAVLQYAEPR